MEFFKKNEVQYNSIKKRTWSKQSWVEDVNTICSGYNLKKKYPF